MKKSNFGQRITALLLMLVLVCTLTLPALADTGIEEDTGIDLKIAVMSDTHYLAPSLIKDTEDYTTALNSDRKLLTEGSEINNAMLDAVRRDKPDVLLISGDLTKDGEREGHEDFSKRLQQLKADLPELKIYVINGNHDIRNEKAKNFNTEDGIAVPAGRTEPEDFARIYDFVYSDDSILARYTPPVGEESGQLSYTAQVADGVTLIALDTCCYSADNTSDEEAEHETRGEMSASLVAWALEQISAAKARGDRVIGLSHHGFVPHFSMEPEILKMYLVEDYESIAQQLADAGLEMVFTGHMHANDISCMTTDAGNTLYDVETGSNITYPSPLRLVHLREVFGCLTASVSTLSHFGPVTFYNATSGKNETIADVTEYGKARGFSEDMLCTVAGSFVGSALDKFVVVENSVSTWLNDRIVANIKAIVSDLVKIPVTDEKTLLDAVNYIYQSHLGGEDDGNYPDWVQAGLDKIECGDMLDEILYIVKKHAFGEQAAAVKFDNIFTDAVKGAISDYVLRIAYSMGCDTNFPEDNDALIVLSGSLKPVYVPVSCGDASVSAPALISDKTAVVFPTTAMMHALSAEGKSVSVDASAAGAAELTVWQRGMDALSAANKLTFTTADGSIQLDCAVLNDCGDVSVGIVPFELNAAQKRALGSESEGAKVFSVSVRAGGRAICEKCEVGLSYTLPPCTSSNTLTVVSLSDTGAVSAADGRYEGGKVRCSVQSGSANAVINFPFFDVPENAWFFGDTVYAYTNGLFKGTAENTFSPDGEMTRAMLVTVLWRMENEPSADANHFADAQGKWFSSAVDWASANGIVNGTSATSFDPDAGITREQLAAVMYRYAQYKGLDTKYSADISGFADYADISEYAQAAMSWANANGIITGTPNSMLLPAECADRAQVAAILHRFIEGCIYG